MLAVCRMPGLEAVLSVCREQKGPQNTSCCCCCCCCLAVGGAHYCLLPGACLLVLFGTFHSNWSKMAVSAASSAQAGGRMLCKEQGT